MARRYWGEEMDKIDCLIQQNIGLIKDILKQYSLFNDPEAESIAYEALWRACVDYDEALGYKRSTLIITYLKNALGTYIRTLNKQRQIEVVSYNNIAYTEDNVNHEFLELLTSYETAETVVMKDITNKRVREVYTAQFNKLCGKKKAIIKVWETSGFTCTNKVIAAATHVSQPYVNQVVAMFKQMLRENLKEDYYE